MDRMAAFASAESQVATLAEGELRVDLSLPMNREADRSEIARDSWSQIQRRCNAAGPHRPTPHAVAGAVGWLRRDQGAFEHTLIRGALGV